MDIKLPKKLRGPDGFRAEIISSGNDYSHSVPLFCVEIKDGEKKRYKMLFDAAKPNTDQIRKALLFFRHDKAWREYFKVPETTPTWRLSDRLSLEAYDPQAFPYFQALRQRGNPVIRYNKGSEHPLGSICTLHIHGSWPPALAEIAVVNQWMTHENGISINCPRGASHLARASFLLMLDDWISESLDLTGKRYKVDREARPLLPDWPAYPATALAEQELINRKKTEKINRFLTPVTFDEYCQLTSGRDTFSNQSLDQLCKQLEGDEALSILNEMADNPIIFAKSLRWRLRGLSVMHTIEKYRVDDILHNHAQNERERKRLERSQATSPEAP